MTKVTLADMATMSLAELANLSGASTDDVQNWLKRLSFRTRFAKTTQGKAQQFNRENAVEICMIARLVRAGMSPAEAAKRVGILFKQFEPYIPDGWVCFLSDERIPILQSDEPPTAKQLDILDETDSVYVLINATRLVERVAAHFAPDEEDEVAE
jgi:hypothetical protein